MSLVTLAFGSKNRASSPEAVAPGAIAQSGRAVSTPEDRLRQKILRTGAEGTAIIRKACRFFSRDEIFVLAEVTEGLVSQDMKIFAGEKQLEVIDMESKYGRAAKQGMTIGLTLRNVEEEDLPTGSALNFKLASS